MRNFIRDGRPYWLVSLLREWHTTLHFCTNLGSVVCSGGAGFRPGGAFLAVVPRRTLIAVRLIHWVAEDGSAAAVVAGQAVPGDLRQPVRPAVPKRGACV